jgi:TonB family protein
MRTLVLLAIHSSITVAQGIPAPPAVTLAHVAWRPDQLRQCPDLRIAADGATVVLFQVGVSGVPSRASLKSSSGSQALDTAAVNCVLKLKFQPATRAGDGVPIESWQELAWRWATQREQHGGTQGTAGRAAPASDANSSTPIATNKIGASVGPESAAPRKLEVELHVCSDVAGKLVQEPAVVRSSGDPGIDEAAVAIVKSGSGYYRPATALGGQPVSGCAQVAISFTTE